MIKILLKKDITEMLSFTKRNKKVDVAGLILWTLLLLGCITFGIWLFAKLINVYAAIRIDNILDIKSREFELVTLVYFVLIIAMAFDCSKTLQVALFKKEDLKAFTSMPIRALDIFFSKIILLYVRQLAIAVAIVLPVNLTFAVVAEVDIVYIMTSVFISFLLPLISMAIGSIICLPSYYIKQLLSNKYLLVIFVFTLACGIVFWGYSKLLEFFNSLITTGEIAYFFNEQTMEKIIKFSRFAYPAKQLSCMLLNIGFVKNLIEFLSMCIGGFVLTSGLTILLFNKASVLRYAPKDRVAIWDNFGNKKSLFVTLIKKDFLTVYKTPGYATTYFSTALIMPLMIYLCTSLGQNLIHNLLFINCNFEIALCVTILFGVLTNTFCATNISRDGKSFYILKTMPISKNVYLGEKVVFSSIVSMISTGVSCSILSALRFTTFAQGAYIFAIAAMLSLALICYATYRDFRNPTFSQEDDGEVKESNASVTRVIIYGLFNSITIGTALIALSIYFGLKGSTIDYRAILLSIVAIIAIFELAVAALVLFKPTKERGSI